MRLRTAWSKLWISEKLGLVDRHLVSKYKWKSKKDLCISYWFDEILPVRLNKNGAISQTLEYRPWQQVSETQNHMTKFIAAMNTVVSSNFCASYHFSRSRERTVVGSTLGDPLHPLQFHLLQVLHSLHSVTIWGSSVQTHESTWGISWRNHKSITRKTYKSFVWWTLKKHDKDSKLVGRNAMFM